MNKEHAIEEVKQLIEYYKELTQKDIESFSEEDTKKDFILPLFHALGWQTNRRDVVVAEEQISKGFVDYSFRINGVTQFYLEAKPLKADLEDVKYAKQSINYAWLKNRTWAVLTDFEGIKVFNAQLDIKDPYYATVLDLKFDEFIEKFDKLWLLSPESFLNGALDKYAEEIHKKKGGVSVSEQLAEDLNEWRRELSKHFKQLNPKLTAEEIDEGVQKILDRLIFIRTCEDRGIENESLRAKYREWKDRGRKGNFQTTLKKLFEEYNHIYNSGLFAYHPVVEWDTYSTTFEEIIDGLYQAKGGLLYDFKQIDADVLGSVYEQYLGFVQGKKEDKKDSKRKKQGIYYTPTYIVDYIVKNTLGELIKEGKDVSDIKILDPACGSGSFLIKAFEYLVGEVKNEDKTKEYESDKIKAIAKQYQIRNEQKELPKSKKINILRNNIYGVDLDEQAIEIAKLNLLLKATDQKEKLPYLTNLRNGNSLVSGTEKELKEYFGKDWKDKKPFNWNEEFEDVMKHGGFSVAIGNPPYGTKMNEDAKKYFKDIYNDVHLRTPDYFNYFISRSLRLLRDGGYLGFIVPNNLLFQNEYEKTRNLLLNNFQVMKIINCGDKVFKEANVPTCIFIVRKTPKDDYSFDYADLRDERNFLDISFEKHQKKDVLNTNSFTFGINKGSISLIEKIKEKSYLIDKIVEEMASGVSTGGDKVFRVSAEFAKENNLEKELLRPVLVGGEIDSYNIENTKHVLIYINRKIDIKKYPNIFNYLEKYKPLLSTRSEVKQGILSWYAMNRARYEDLFLGEKIILRQTADSIRATLDKENYFILDSILVLRLKKETGLDYKFVLAVLNSNLSNYIYKEMTQEVGRTFAQVKPKNVRKLFIPKVSKEEQKSLSNKAEDLIKLNQQLQDIKDVSEEQERIKNKIEKIKQDIDEEVYGIYKLSKEEIKIIEGEKNELNERKKI